MDLVIKVNEHVYIIKLHEDQSILFWMQEEGQKLIKRGYKVSVIGVINGTVMPGALLELLDIIAT